MSVTKIETGNGRSIVMPEVDKKTGGQKVGCGTQKLPTKDGFVFNIFQVDGVKPIKPKPVALMCSEPKGESIPPFHLDPDWTPPKTLPASPHMMQLFVGYTRLPGVVGEFPEMVQVPTGGYASSDGHPISAEQNRLRIAVINQENGVTSIPWELIKKKNGSTENVIYEKKVCSKEPMQVQPVTMDITTKEREGTDPLQKRDPLAIHYKDESNIEVDWDTTIATSENYLWKIVRDKGRTLTREDQEDVFQKVVIRIMNGLSGYDDKDFQGWIAKITINTIKDKFRQDARRPTTSIDDASLKLLEQARPSERQFVSQQSDQPEEVLERKQQRNWLERMLSRISPRFADVIALHHYYGLSEIEIGDLRTMPIGTVKSHMSRGLENLRVLAKNDPYVIA